MRRISFLLSAFFLVSAGLQAQTIPNGSFENWESISNYEKPEDWETNQSQDFERIEKSSESTDGDYALKLLPGGPSSKPSGWSICESVANGVTQFDSELGENKSLYFMARSEALEEQDTTYISVSAQSSEGSQVLGADTWNSYDEIDEYQLIEIPLTYPEATSLSIHISGGLAPFPADGCQYPSHWWIDDMRIEESGLSSQENDIDKNDITVYPNPTNGQIFIDGSDDRLQRYYIYDVAGRILDQGSFEDSAIDLDSKGFLMVVLETETGKLLKYKIVNR